MSLPLLTNICSFKKNSAFEISLEQLVDSSAPTESQLVKNSVVGALSDLIVIKFVCSENVFGEFF